MIFESFPWKQDLRRRKNLIIKYNTAEYFEKMMTPHTSLSKRPFSILHSSFEN